MSKPGYLKKSVVQIGLMNESWRGVDIKIALAKAKQDYKNGVKVINTTTQVVREAMRIVSKDVRKPKAVRDGLIKSNSTKYNEDNVLFIPDLHAPFIKDGFLEFCIEQQKKYDCGTVIFAGDIVDGHAWSYHEHDPDGLSVGDELEAAKKQLKDWYEAFPNAIVLMGNHDLLIQRKAKTAGLSKQFIKGFGDVLEAPKTWEFKLEHTKDNVLYKHGSVGDAFKVAKSSRMSTCQGHFHSKTFVQWSVSERDAIFGLQVGWGADRHKYAFDYGKSFTEKPILSVGIILDKGLTPIVKMMPL